MAILFLRDERGQVQQAQGFSSMQGSWRLEGGLGALTQALADRLPDARKHLDSTVTKLEKKDNCVFAIFSNGTILKSDRVVLALPPRIAAQIDFSPALDEPTIQAMRGIATWMAGQAKAVAVYETPFWREAGLSGDAMSRRGPMVEIHDASPHQGGPYALFGFIGVSPETRSNQQLLTQHLEAQFVRLFGPKAGKPVKLYIKDWAFDSNTSTAADMAPVYNHPVYGLPPTMNNLWDNSLHFAGTEVAPQFGGYVEGALEAAENVLQILNAQT